MPHTIFPVNSHVICGYLKSLTLSTHTAHKHFIHFDHIQSEIPSKSQSQAILHLNRGWRLLKKAWPKCTNAFLGETHLGVKYSLQDGSSKTEFDISTRQLHRDCTSQFLGQKRLSIGGRSVSSNCTQKSIAERS